MRFHYGINNSIFNCGRQLLVRAIDLSLLLTLDLSDFIENLRRRFHARASARNLPTALGAN